MDLFRKPCGCRGRGFLCRDMDTITVRIMYVDNEEFNSPLGGGKLLECGTCVSGNFPSYTSTDIIEMQEEKEKVEEKNWTQTLTKRYLLYGCLKCGDTWRKHYKTWTDRDWNE